MIVTILRKDSLQSNIVWIFFQLKTFESASMNCLSDFSPGYFEQSDVISAEYCDHRNTVVSASMGTSNLVSLTLISTLD